MISKVTLGLSDTVWDLQERYNDWLITLHYPIATFEWAIRIVL